MKKKQKQTAYCNHPFETITWSSLTDSQKAEYFLNSWRLTDAEQFQKQYISFEEPSVENQVDPQKFQADVSSVDHSAKRHLKIADLLKQHYSK